MAASVSLPMGMTKMKSGSISMTASRLKSFRRLLFSSARLFTPRSANMAPVCVPEFCTRVPPENVVSKSAVGGFSAGTAPTMASIASATFATF